MPAFDLRRHLHDRWVFLLLSAACIVVAYVFTTLGLSVLEGEMAGVDRAVRDWFSQHRSTGAVLFFETVSLLGGKSALVVLGVLVGWRVSGGSKTLVVLLVLCAIVSSEFIDFLKVRFSVVRPPRGMAERQSFGFPSGHVSGTASIATLLAFAALRHRVAPRLVITAGALITISMAFSRIYLDMHWTSDAIGGLLIGVTMGLAFCALYEWSDRRQRRQVQPPSSGP